LANKLVKGKPALYGSVKTGSWAFIFGVIVAIVAGAFSDYVSMYASWIVLLLGLLGLVVGFMNVTSKETVPFLVAAIALVASTASFNLVLETVGGSAAAVVQTTLGFIAVFVAPAAIVVALKAIFALASEK